jgi:hypothetical protein
VCTRYCPHDCLLMVESKEGVDNAE